MVKRRAPGVIRDAIIKFFLRRQKKDAHISEIHQGVQNLLGEEVPYSSVRSYLRLNTPDIFQRVERGYYRYVGKR
jgi:site-specific DNA-methyltransferase (adenine-specific)